MVKSTSNDDRSGYKLVFCRSIRRNGRIVYPKRAKFFRFWMKAN